MSDECEVSDINILARGVPAIEPLGVLLLDFSMMLYPQYESLFDKVISADVWKILQDEARKELDNINKPNSIGAADNVIEHWKSIVDGKIPFGYTVKND